MSVTENGLAYCSQCNCSRTAVSTSTLVTLWLGRRICWPDHFKSSRLPQSERTENGLVGFSRCLIAPLLFGFRRSLPGARKIINVEYIPQAGF